MRALRIAIMTLFLASPATSDEAQPPENPTPANEAVIGFGVSHPACQEWTDGCVICKRVADAFACSTAGVACQPTPTICKAPPQ